MKVLTFVLLLPFLMGLSSCTDEKIIYQTVYREVYPTVPVYKKLETPRVNLKVWGDYAIYKEQCEATIMEGNLNLESIYKSLERVEDETK